MPRKTKDPLPSGPNPDSGDWMFARLVYLEKLEAAWRDAALGEERAKKALKEARAKISELEAQIHIQIAQARQAEFDLTPPGEQKAEAAA